MCWDEPLRDRESLVSWRSVAPAAAPSSSMRASLGVRLLNTFLLSKIISAGPRSVHLIVIGDDANENASVIQDAWMPDGQVQVFSLRPQECHQIAHGQRGCGLYRFRL